MDDEREQLYQTFKKLAGERHITEYFDEDDLVDIYDYANDVSDDFVKMEVLYYGARVHPDSDSLAIRRNYLYYYLGNDEATRTMLAKRGEPTTLSRLLELRERVDRGESIVDGVNDILARAAQLDDEEVIQLVNESGTDEHYQWVKRNMRRIAAKCSYKPTLYYEAVSLAQDHNDSAYALQMAEELTMLEPFNVDFWQMMAELHLTAEDYDACLSTIDYALAIDPESAKSITIKGIALARKDPKSQEALDLLWPLREREDFDPDGLQTIATLLLNLERVADAEAFLRQCHERLPGNPAPLDSLMLVFPEKVPEWGELLHSPGFPDDESFWADWAERHIRDNRVGDAALILSVSYNRNRNRGHYPLFLECLYRQGCYEEVLRFFNEMANIDGLHPTLECFMLAVLAMARIGSVEEALALINQVYDMGADWAPDNLTWHLPAGLTRTYGSIRRVGYQHLLDTLRHTLETTPQTDHAAFEKAIDAVDPTFRPCHLPVKPDNTTIQQDQ